MLPWVTATLRAVTQMARAAGGASRKREWRMHRAIPEIVSRHAEEAALCWLWRDRGVAEPHYSLNDLAHLDNRLDAHLDGLRIAGEDGWAECETQLRWREPGEVFIAAVLAVETRDRRRIESVAQRAGDNRGLWRAIASALGWHSLDIAQPFIGSLANDSDAHKRRLGIAAAAIQRYDLGDVLGRALADEDRRVRARALRAIGELGRTDLVAAACEQVTSDDGACRAAAAWSVGRLDARDGPLEPDVIKALRDAVENGWEGSDRCLRTLACRVEPSAARELIHTWSIATSTAHSAVTAAGTLGDPALVPWLLDRLDAPPLARLAGEAITMITGLALDERPLEGQWPEGFVAGPTEDPEDENVAMEPDENLPWPNRQAVADWWAKHRQRFEPGTRYLLGRPIMEEWLEEVLRHGYQRQRAAAALELAMRRPGQPLFEVRAPGPRQQKLLGLKWTRG